MSSGENRAARFAWERALLDARLGRKDQGVGKSGRLSTGFVGLALATYAGRDGGNIFPGQEALASRLGCSVRTVREALAELHRLGFLVKVGPPPSSHGRAQEYRLSIPIHRRQPVAGASPLPVADDTEAHRQPVASQQTISLPSSLAGSTGPADLESLAAAAAAGDAEAIEALVAHAPGFEDEPEPVAIGESIRREPESPLAGLDAREVEKRRRSHERMLRDENYSEERQEPKPPRTRRYR